ncbi:hypothetical protein L901_18105 [Agrobacterium sp. D14]|nr:hypothetical protein L901_18105 [Agrobacterium sp. D14]
MHDNQRFDLLIGRSVGNASTDTHTEIAFIKRI